LTELDNLKLMRLHKG